MPTKPLTFRALKRALLAHDPRFSFRPGKGSEVILSHPAIRAACCIPRHGDGHTVRPPVLQKVARKFALPPGFFHPGHRRKSLAPSVHSFGSPPAGPVEPHL